MKEFTITSNDQLVVRSLRKAIQANQEALGAYMGQIAVERWGYPTGRLLTFDLAQIDTNKITVNEVNEDGGSKPKSRASKRK